jgi:ribosomal-protein-alanine N-acetyltransferase
MLEHVPSDGVVALRRWRSSDIKGIVEMCRDAEIVRWTRVPSPYKDGDAENAIAAQERGWEDGTSYGFGVVDAASDRLLGSIDVRIVAEGIGDVGYLVSAEARRKGVGKRALLLVSRWAFEELGLVRLQIAIRPENVASRRLADSCGYQLEGVLRSWLDIKDERVDVAMYSLLPGEIDRLSHDE